MIEVGVALEARRPLRERACEALLRAGIADDDPRAEPLIREIMREIGDAERAMVAIVKEVLFGLASAAHHVVAEPKSAERRAKLAQWLAAMVAIVKEVLFGGAQPGRGGGEGVTKFTAGPWHVKEAKDEGGPILFHTIHVAADNNGFCDYVASTWGGPHAGNASLIAAAPELYVALDAITRLAIDRVGDEPPVVQAALAALAKARGEAA